MQITRLSISDIFLIEPNVFFDKRGFFYESFNQDHFEESIGHAINFVQDNHSKSQHGVLRGLHYQRPPKEQGKLIRVLVGEVFDVALDIRKMSSTFGKWVSAVLSADNKHQLWIPTGFAHGFYVISEFAEILYKTTDYYSPEHQKCIRWDDPSIGIKWPLRGIPILSPRDQDGEYFIDATEFMSPLADS